MEQVKKLSIKDLFSNLFGNNDIEDDLEITDNELLKTIKSVDEEGEKIAKTIVTEKKSSKNGGFSEGLSKFDKTLEKMKAKKDKSNSEIEKSDDITR